MRRRGVLSSSLRAGCWLLCLGATITGHAQGERVADEYQVKAAYLYKFLGFVEWPQQAFETTQSPFVIGVIGADALADELAQVVANRQASGRPAIVRKLRPGESTTGLHVLFIGREAAHRASALLAAAKDTLLLTVTETEEAFAAGSAINFVVVDKKVRFDVALHGAETGAPKISSRLLGVARRVVGGNS
ncbi:MAG: YfiR family protein [Rhizobacter sp.]